MSKLTHQVTINAPVDEVWEVLADFGAIDKWAPPVSKSYSTTEANGGVGAGRHCDTSFGTCKGVSVPPSFDVIPHRRYASPARRPAPWSPRSGSAPAPTARA